MARAVLCFLGLLLLVSCGSTPSYKGYKRAPYTVRGERYHPMTVEQALTFREEGIASWYDESSFFGMVRGKTALGEKVYSGTECAAHKTLPLPAEIRVTNLKNGKSTKVRVNDRGPFIKGRIVDLSPAVAKKLDMKKSGLAPVRIEVISVGDGKWKRKAKR